MILEKIACLAVTVELALSCSLAGQSGLGEIELERGLRKELKPLASTFVEIEEQYNIDSTVYASIVALESGWGTSTLSKSKNNITSFTDSNGLKSYDSKEECLWDMAENLSSNYLNEDGKYYGGGFEVEDVACFYLIGKSRDEMDSQELERVEEYAEIVEGIRDGIVERATAPFPVCPS